MGGVKRAVFFDYDGVLTLDATGTQTTMRYLANWLDFPCAQVEAAWREAATLLGNPFCRHEVLWAAFCEKLGRAVPLELLPEAFASTRLDLAMLDLASRLRVNYPVGIITDNCPDRFDFLCRQQKLDACFDPVLVSSFVGHTKASPVIFEQAVQRVGLAAHECIFIDNSPANIAVAEKSGLSGLYFDDRRRDVAGLVEQLKSDCGLCWAD